MGAPILQNQPRSSLKDVQRLAILFNHLMRHLVHSGSKMLGWTN